MYIYTVKFFQQLCLIIVDCSLLPRVHMCVCMYSCVFASLSLTLAAVTNTRARAACFVRFLYTSV